MVKGNFVIRYRWLIIILFTGLTSFFAMHLSKAKIDSDLKNYMPKSMPSRISSDKIEELFGGSEIVLVLFETKDILQQKTLKRIKKISKGLQKVKGVEDVMSLFTAKSIKGQDGAMIVDPAIPRIPSNNKNRELLRADIKDNDFVYEVVVSKDFTITAIIGVLEPDLQDDSINAEIQALIEKYPGDEKVYIGGMPITRIAISKDISEDFSYLLPTALFLMLVMLYISFRQFRGVLLPFLAVIMSIIVGMGLLPMIGWKISVITILLPIMLVAIANDYGIHLVARYQELSSKNPQMPSKQVTSLALSSLAKPIILTALTTIAGILGLLSHVMIPARQLGIVAAIGIGYALILSLLFIPAILSLLKTGMPKSQITNAKKPFLDRLLVFFSNLVAKHPIAIISGAVLIIIISLMGVLLLKVDANTENFFPEKHTVKITSNLINKHFGGSQNITVLFTGDIKDPTLLKRMDEYEQTLKNTVGVGNVSSIATIIKEMSKALNDKGDPLYNKIPDSKEAVAQYIELYSMSGDPDDFEKLVDFNYENALLIVRLDDGSTVKIKTVVNKIRELVKKDTSVKMIGGFGLLQMELADIVVRGQIISLFMAVFVIAILMMIMFKSVSAGILSAIPLTLAIAILFGLMGFFGINLDIATAMLSSIMIGVGVDYTIHFLWRYREERKNGLDYNDAVLKTLTTTGRGIIFNAFSVVVGFSALLVSLFVPIKFFGFLVIVSIIACLIGALVLVPALCIVWKPGFLEPN